MRGEAEVAQGALAGVGIECFVGSDAGGAYPFSRPRSASLLVEEADAAAAEEILGEANSEGERAS